MEIVAILNDTTGTMMACAFQEPTCNIGVICGTGTNACYMEKVNKIHKLNNKLNGEGGDNLLPEVRNCGTFLVCCPNSHW